MCDSVGLADSRLRQLSRELFGPDPGLAGRLPFLRRSAPGGDPIERRRKWALAMSLRAFAALGVLDSETELLVIGPRCEEAVYWLTLRTRRVFTTHLERVEGAWSVNSSGDPILADPGRQTEHPWNPRRLVLQPMRPTDLRLEDGSLDVVLSANVLEHLSSIDEAMQVAREMHRVLKPGGVAAVSTTFRAEQSAEGPPGLLLFDEPELRAALLGDGLSWAIADPLDVSAPDSEVASRDGDQLWTSVHLLLVKPLYH